jgi:hypothetical protein
VESCKKYYLIMPCTGLVVGNGGAEAPRRVAARARDGMVARCTTNTGKPIGRGARACKTIREFKQYIATPSPQKDIKPWRRTITRYRDVAVARVRFASVAEKTV